MKRLIDFRPIDRYTNRNNLCSFHGIVIVVKYQSGRIDEPVAIFYVEKVAWQWRSPSL
jgi:hypothetical protein